MLHAYIDLTGYKDLQTRKETREMAWSKPGWDECVAYTGKWTSVIGHFVFYLKYLCNLCGNLYLYVQREF